MAEIRAQWVRENTACSGFKRGVHQPLASVAASRKEKEIELLK